MRSSNLLTIIIIIIILTSCQNDDLVYSCDPEINSYVTDNKQKFAQIDVLQITSYEYPLQKAIFNSWDFGKKREEWINKLNYVISNENLTIKEVDHLQKLIFHIQPDYFSDDFLNKNSEQISQFAATWLDFSIRELGWSDQFIAFIVYRLYINQSQFEAELSELRSIMTNTSANSESNCSCNTSEDFCGDYFRCSSTGCSSSGGCGWLWSQTCNGTCY